MVKDASMLYIIMYLVSFSLLSLLINVESSLLHAQDLGVLLEQALDKAVLWCLKANPSLMQEQAEYVKKMQDPKITYVKWACVLWLSLWFSIFCNTSIHR
jgi:hypothetical protein